jgi:hypothetical protein
MGEKDKKKTRQLGEFSYCSIIRRYPAEPAEKRCVSQSFHRPMH